MSFTVKALCVAWTLGQWTTGLRSKIVPTLNRNVAWNSLWILERISVDISIAGYISDFFSLQKTLSIPLIPDLRRTLSEHVLNYSI